MDEPRPLTAKLDPRMNWFLRCFWLVWLAVGVGVLASGLAWQVAALRIIGPVLIVGMAMMFLLTNRRINDPRPVLQIGPEGYHDRRIGKLIPWNEVKRLVRHQPGNRVYLLLQVEDPSRFIATSTPLRSAALRLNPKMGFPAICSPIAGLDQPQEALIQTAEAFWAAARRN